jgi:hypothetical protein
LEFGKTLKKTDIMKALKHALLILLVSCLIFSCEQAQEVESEAIQHSGYYLEKKGDKIFLYTLSAEATLSEMLIEHSRELEQSLIGTSFYPKGIAFTEEGLQTSKNAFGKTYYAVSSPQMRMTSSTELVLSGISYKAGTYYLTNGERYLYPVYNNDETNPVPDGNFSLHKADGEFLMNLTEGIIDLEVIHTMQLTEEYDVYYQLNDESQGSDNVTKIRVRFMSSAEYQALASSRQASGTDPDTDPETDPQEIIVITDDPNVN